MTYVGYDSDISLLLFIGIVVTAYILFLHISFVLGIIYQIDQDIEKNEVITITSDRSRFNNEFSSIVSISLIAILPVIVYTGIVSLITYFIAKTYDFELPGGFALLGWSLSFILASTFFLILVLPWSLDTKFSMYKMKESNT